MKRSNRLVFVGTVGISLTAAVAAYGTGGASASTARTANGGYAPGGTLQVSMGSPPESLDPQSGYSSESQEADWLVYTPLVTYAHKDGLAGDTLIPGLATALPTVSDGGTTYTATLRKGLQFSNGVAVKASDFTYTIERDLKVGWGGDSFYTSNIVGAAAYQAGKSKTISGIVTNNATGQITIHLLAPYGAFDNILAFPSSGLVPTGTAMTALSTNPPPGVGAYKITSVKPNISFTLEKNSLFAGFHIPGIPVGYVNTVQVTVQTNADTEAQDVLNNTSDEFDWGDVIPPAYVAQVQSQAKDRYTPETLAATDYFWLNTHIAPFNNVLAREAANLAVSRVALQRLASGQITPTCYYLPPSIVGHASGSCPLGDPSGNGSYSATSLGSPADIALATKLVKKAGLTGAPVTVWTENREPFEAFVTYLNSQLNAIGFKSTLKVVSSGVFDPTIGSAKVDPQAGWGEWSQDYPNPGDFYLVLDARSIAPVNNLNLGYINDAHIQSTIIRLDKVQSSDLTSVASQWAALERYVDSKDYQVNFGYEVSPFFLSDRVDFATAVFQPVFGDDWSTFELKSFNYRHSMTLGGDAYTAGTDPYRLAFRRLGRNHTALFFGALFVLVVVLCLLAPVYAHYIAHTGPNDQHITEVLQLDGKSVDVVSLTGVPIGPTWHSRFFLGADADGRDLAVRLLYGGRTSLAIGAMATGITIVVATVLGLVAGFYGGWADSLISRALDIVWAYPVFLLAIALGVSLATGGISLGPVQLTSGSIFVPTLVIGVVYVPYVARPVRGEVLALREREFVEAARALGASNLRIMVSEILPNLAPTVVVFISLQLAHSIILEAALSFLGAGVQPPAASWGTLLSAGAPLFTVAPYLTLAPATFLVATCLGVNIFGDGLRDALDPRARVRAVR